MLVISERLPLKYQRRSSAQIDGGATLLHGKTGRDVTLGKSCVLCIPRTASPYQSRRTLSNESNCKPCAQHAGVAVNSRGGSGNEKSSNLRATSHWLLHLVGHG